MMLSVNARVFVEDNKMLFAISQPMANKTKEEIIAERAKIREEYESKGWKFKETLIDEFSGEKNALWFLGESLKRLSECDYVIFVEGWKEARGCRLENECCKAYGIKVIERD